MLPAITKGQNVAADSSFSSQQLSDGVSTISSINAFELTRFRPRNDQDVDSLRDEVLKAKLAELATASTDTTKLSLPKAAEKSAAPISPDKTVDLDLNEASVQTSFTDLSTAGQAAAAKLSPPGRDLDLNTTRSIGTQFEELSVPSLVAKNTQPLRHLEPNVIRLPGPAGLPSSEESSIPSSYGDKENGSSLLKVLIPHTREFRAPLPEMHGRGRRGGLVDTGMGLFKREIDPRSAPLHVETSSTS